MPFESADAFERWLEEHHAHHSGIWMKIAKKASGIPSVTYAEAVDVALCHGWIDGQKDKFDDQFFLQRFTQRRPKSVWSKVNREKVAALTRAGRMKPAGLEQVERAKADGRWDAAYDAPSTATVPDDLQAALDARPKAAELFKTLNSTNRYAILYQVQTAKRAETRTRRIEKYVAMLERGEKPYP